MLNPLTERSGKLFPRRRLTVQVVLPVALVSLLLLSLGVGGAWYVHSLQRRTSELLSQEISSIHTGEELLLSLTSIRNVLNRFLIAAEDQPDEARRLLRQVGPKIGEARDWLNRASRLAQTAQEQTHLAQVERHFGEFGKAFDEALDLREEAELQAAIQHLSSDVLDGNIIAPTQAFLDLNERSVTQSAAANRALASRLSIIMLVIGVCGAAAGLVMGYGLARAIYHAMIQLSLPLRAVAGQLQVADDAITVSGDLEFADLEHMLQVLSDRVAVLVDQLTRARGEALRAEQLAAVGQLAAGLAHELRNPLMSMKLLVQAAVADNDDPQLSHRDLGILEDEIGRLEQLVQTFLDFARPPMPQPRLLDLVDVVAGVTEFVSRRAARQGVVIHRYLPSSPVTMQADAGQMKQLALNLLLNALDSLPSGGVVQVRIDVSSARPAGAATAKTVTLTVQDNGQGLPSHLRERIFEPFVTTKPNGMGLGLSICRRIVESHGGAIAVGSSPAKGAEFVVRLPAHVPLESAYVGEPLPISA